MTIYKQNMIENIDNNNNNNNNIEDR